MLLMVVVGVGNLGRMLVLGAVMAAEKGMPWGRRVSTPLGVLLIGRALTVTFLAGPVGRSTSALR
jgi:predicted metal-binding membrane protein